MCKWCKKARELGGKMCRPCWKRQSRNKKKGKQFYLRVNSRIFRGRSTVGRGAVNAPMLVRFQPSEPGNNKAYKYSEVA